MQTKSLSIVAGLAACALFGGLTPVAEARKATINVTITTTPRMPLPESIKAIRVQKPSYNDRAADNGIMMPGLMQFSHDYSRYPFWYWYGGYGLHGGSRSTTTSGGKEMFYRALLQEIEQTIQRGRPDLQVLEYEDRGIGDDIRDDRRAQGLRDGGAGQSVQQPDAVIVARFSHEVTKRQSWKRDSGGERVAKRIFGRTTGIHLGRGGKHQEVWAITVTCNLKLWNPLTGDIYAAYGEPLTVTQKTKDGFASFGESTSADFDAVAPVITKLVKQHVRRFLAQVIPVEVPIVVPLKHVSRRCARAIVQLNAENFQEAAAIAHDAFGHRDKDHRACFVAGLANEALGKEDSALTWYNRALVREDNEKKNAPYRKAVKRIRKRQDDERRAALQRRHDDTPPPSESRPVVTPDAPESTGASASAGVVEATPDAEPSAASADHGNSMTDQKSSRPDARATAAPTDQRPPAKAPECVFKLESVVLLAVIKTAEQRRDAGMTPNRVEDLLAEAVAEWLVRNGAQGISVSGFTIAEGSPSCVALLPEALTDALRDVGADRVLDGVTPYLPEEMASLAVFEWAQGERERMRRHESTKGSVAASDESTESIKSEVK